MHYHTTTILWLFFRDHPGEPGPEQNFWTLWCKGRLTEADTLDHPAGHHSIQTNQCPPSPFPIFFTGRMPFLPPNQQCQSTFCRSSWISVSYTHCCITPEISKFKVHNDPGPFRWSYGIFYAIFFGNIPLQYHIFRVLTFIW